MKSFFFSFNFLLVSIFALPLSMCSKDNDSENLDNGIDIETPVAEDEIAEEPTETAVETKDFKWLWTANYGTANHDYGYSLAHLGSTFVFAGQFNGIPANNDGEAILYGTDENFDKKWEISYPIGEFRDVISTTDGNFLAVGRIGKNQSGDRNSKIFVVKFNSNGDILWEHTVVTTNDDSLGAEAYAVAESGDGGFVLIGSTPNNPDVFGSDVVFVFKGGFALKLSSEGDLVWAKQYSEISTPLDIIKQENSGDFYISGGLGVAEVVKINGDGELIQSAQFDSDDFDNFRSIYEMQNGNFVMTGNTHYGNDGDVNNNKGLSDVWVAVIDSELNLLQDHNFGSSGNDYGASIKELSNGNFICIGIAGNEDKDVYRHRGTGDYWLIKLSPDFKIIDQISFGGFDRDSPNDFILFEEKNELVIFGETYSSGTINIRPKGEGDHLIMRIQY